MPELLDAHDTAADLGLLPGILREIAELIGLPGAMTLARAYGGVRLYVPKRYDPDHPLVKLLGHAAAAKLIEQYGGGEHFDIPLAANALRAVRNANIRRDRLMGATHRDLALRYAMTERTVRAILGRELDDCQGALF